MKGIIKKIDRINFGLMSPEQIREMSVVKIERPDTYDEDGYPIESGLMDSRLGVIDPSLKCRTCGEKGGECQGHFGMIELARPVIHVGFGDDIHKILRSTCSECGRVLLDDDEIEEYTKKMRELQKDGESVEELVKEVYKICKDKKTKEVCPHCGAEQEDIKIVKPIDIIEVRKQYDENGELITNDNGVPVTEDYDLTASEVREMLQRIPDEDAYVLGVNPEVARPEWMVLTVLPVPPVTVRPSITLDTGERSEDDLTHKLVDILRINQRLIENMDAGAPQLIVEDLWKLLQYHVITYFDNEASGVPPARHRSGRPLKTLAQRLKGKEGRFRSNLSGKRVNFSARTVISPDPNISINEVGVPEMIAKEVTVPTYVNEWNIEELKKAILNGPNVHPGANYVKKHINGKEMKVRVLEDNREVVSENLDYGDIVMRHLKDGDVVLFNRQPSLHRMSMMAHEVRVLPYKTFRLNLCVCPPYNADFDGDEMNMHVFQTDESRAEAKSLMRVQEHILSPRFGGPIIGAIHDHISGGYLLTREGTKFPEDQAFQAIRKSHLLNNPYVNKTHLKRKYRDWTGKELFSLLLPDDLNMNYRNELCRKCETCKGEKCLFDAYVVIKDGELTHGAIDEAAYGSFSGKILDTIVKEYGSSRAKEFLDRSTDLAIWGIMKMGITTSTNDEEIPEEYVERIDIHLDKAEKDVDKLVKTYEEGFLQPLPGRSAEETLEMRIVQVLGEARDKSGEIARKYFSSGRVSENANEFSYRENDNFVQYVDFSKKDDDFSNIINEVRLFKSKVDKTGVTVKSEDDKTGVSVKSKVDKTGVTVKSEDDNGGVSIEYEEKRAGVTVKYVESVVPGPMSSEEESIESEVDKTGGTVPMSSEEESIESEVDKTGVTVKSVVDETVGTGGSVVDETVGTGGSVVDETVGTVASEVDNGDGTVYISSEEESIESEVDNGDGTVPMSSEEESIESEVDKTGVTVKSEVDKTVIYEEVRPGSTITYEESVVTVPMSSEEESIESEVDKTGVTVLMSSEGKSIESEVDKTGVTVKYAETRAGVTVKYEEDRADSSIKYEVVDETGGSIKYKEDKSGNITISSKDKDGSNIKYKKDKLGNIIISSKDKNGVTVKYKKDKTGLTIYSEDNNGDMEENKIDSKTMVRYSGIWTNPLTLLPLDNRSAIMARTGARASMLNLAQISACVGQQSVRGGRITRGYLNRPLPHFRKHELGAKAKGFVRSSYKKGLDPVEFFFHAMGGREGLVDTAIRTAQSGYMQRRLVNALEDLNVSPDGLVKDNNNQVIQTVFGEDGIDPAKSDFGKVANLDKLIDEMRVKEGSGK